MIGQFTWGQQPPGLAWTDDDVGGGVATTARRIAVRVPGMRMPARVRRGPSRQVLVLVAEVVPGLHDVLRDELGEVGVLVRPESAQDRLRHRGELQEKPAAR